MLNGRTEAAIWGAAPSHPGCAGAPPPHAVTREAPPSGSPPDEASSRGRHSRSHASRHFRLATASPLNDSLAAPGSPRRRATTFGKAKDKGGKTKKKFRKVNFCRATGYSKARGFKILEQEDTTEDANMCTT